MGFGDTARRLQRVADTAEDVYGRVNELKERLQDTQATVERTERRVDRIEADLAEQRAIVEALAAEVGVDVEAVVREAADGEGRAAPAGTVGASPADDGAKTPDETEFDSPAGETGDGDTGR